jgi:4-hydroxybenzoate polyprenyltransferase
MKILYYFSLIKFSHTIFALPFALIGYVLAIQTQSVSFSVYTLGYVIACMIFARSAAMAFNRYSDYTYDSKNARTANREIPSGKISPSSALIFTIIHSVLFIVTTWFINPICFYLSPVALLVILGYSYTKRFTYICHFILGIGLSLAPIGAYLAVTGYFSLTPILFSCIVFTWTAGFDILYALQDEEFDRSETLFSIPALFGRTKAMRISIGTHIITAILVVITGLHVQLNYIYWIGASIFIGLLAFQHTLIKPHDISKINIAFGTTNGIASVIFAVFTITALYIQF